ncbi:response regulator transcription factor, partial [Arthrobacter sp. Hiyo1]|uniref:response regulator transcription factor n=1 Tax=Arthrobacter sp. Hiyo1 TaxID=1588020 RepID=UPI000A847D31
MSDLDVAVVIEEDADTRNLLETALLQAGFEVHAVGTGRAGVEAVRDVRPDVVTLNVGLPDIDGFEVMRRVRLISNAYVVMVTSRSDQIDLLTALQSGADHHIIKPVRPRELRVRIAAMMRRPQPKVLVVPPPAPRGTVASRDPDQREPPAQR